MIHQAILTAEDLLVGASATYAIPVPAAILQPGAAAASVTAPGSVRMRPLSLATLMLIARAARDDASLVPMLMLKEALVEPVLTLDQVRAMHVGLVHFLVGQAHLISGLAAEGEALADAASSALGQTHLLLARHFGWTPEQVCQLTPGQVAVYLAGIERLLQMEGKNGGDQQH